MKNYPLFITLCASCALMGSVLQAEDQVQPKVVKVGEKAATQSLDAQAEQQPLRAKIDKRDLFDYLDKNYGTTQKKAESQPVKAEELQKPVERMVEKVESQTAQEKPWDIKVAAPVNDTQASQAIEPQQMKPMLPKPAGGVQAKRFVLKGFDDNLPEQKTSVKQEASVEAPVREIPQSAQKQSAPKELGKLSPATGNNARWLDEQPKPAEKSIPVAQAKVEAPEPVSEQKRYPVLNREILENKQVAETPSVPAKVIPEARDAIKLVERPAAFTSAEVDQPRVRAPEAGNERETTKSLNMQMLEAPSAPSKVMVVNKPEIQKEVAEYGEAPAEAKQSVSRKNAVNSGEKVVRSTFTSRVNGLEPADSLSAAKPNARKLYYFSEVAGMTGRKVIHRWEQNGKVLVEKSMTVGSNKWRLWSSATPKSGSKGDLSVSVLDDHGNVLKTESLGMSN